MKLQAMGKRPISFMHCQPHSTPTHHVWALGNRSVEVEGPRAWMVNRRGPAAPVDPAGRKTVGAWLARTTYLQPYPTLQALETADWNTGRPSHKLQQSGTALIIVRLHCLPEPLHQAGALTAVL